MTPEQFAYWLQGYAELAGDAPTPEQWQSIKEHLALVFNKVTLPNPLSPNLKPYAEWKKYAFPEIPPVTC